MFEDLDKDALLHMFSYDAKSPLLFNTCLFLLLFAAFLLIYQVIRKWKNFKLVFVILFSLYFYYKSSAEYCFILLGVCISDYILGRLMGYIRTGSKGWARCLVALNVIINVGMLVYFKYFNLLYETFANITNTHFDALNIILPAGISFFTFRSISYIVDIYRGQIEPAKNFLDYTFFLTFFPPLLAGPVVRAKDMLPQIKENPVATQAMVAEGIFLIVAGLIKKVVIADYISGNFVDRIFENPHLYTGFENIMGIFGFVIQIYCDFSGYSDMAIGIALLMGYRFLDNFDSPFKSQNPTEFWRRWHISLSTWLRDYVYIPLGGNRHGKFRTNLNKMTTMVVGGLWHGASWMYLIWGAYQGILLIGHKAIKSIWHTPQWLKGTWVARTTNIAITFLLTAIGFTIFRFAISSPRIDESWEGVKKMSGQIAFNFRPEVIPQFFEAYLLIILLIIFGYLLHFAPSSWTSGIKTWLGKSHPILLTLLLAMAIFLVIQVRQTDLVPFVYMQY